MPPKYQHCIRGRGTKFENLRSLLIVSRIADLLIKIENFASYTELNLLPCSLPVLAIIVTCQIFLHYNTTIINNCPPPSEPIFLGAPLFRSKIPYDSPPFFASPLPVINNECMVSSNIGIVRALFLWWSEEECGGGRVRSDVTLVYNTS
jgi:hypothetical protein